MLRFEDIWFKYGKDWILKGVSGEALPSRALALVGPTGCGKSTLLFILANLLKPNKGKVTFKGRSVRREEVGLLFQDPDEQLFNPTVFDEIAYALRTLGLGEKEVRERVLSISDRLGIKEFLHKSPHKLSVGQKRLVALASVIVYEPEVLLLDEPSANLDRRSLNAIKEVMEEYKKNRKILIFSTHDPNMILEHADDVCYFEDGKTRCTNVEDFIEDIENTSLPIPRTLEMLLRSMDKRELLERARSR
ncbi:cobalt ABC transporter ATPase [Ignicoccus pacificus DSM 13166]|uniref:Cobalt ABC transporter ATPase n=1 Tax=Ignicoccus pacificus DSM 13166 TaxID=940294 RepID=A0A977KAU8_9CREN|nr:cobalt ABC transporter ATPase [Ignicoccus pacificus DSM 13166]